MLDDKYKMPRLIADDLGRLVEALLGEEKGNLWWDAPRPQFGDMSPKDMWFGGLSQKQTLVAYILDAVIEGLPPPPT